MTGTVVRSGGPRLSETDVRVALERAVRRDVCTVAVDWFGQLITGTPMSFDRAHVVASWTFTPGLREHVNQDEIEWATTVIMQAWTRAHDQGTP